MIAGMPPAAAELSDAFRTRFFDVLRQRSDSCGALAKRLGIGQAHLSRVVNRRQPGSTLLLRALELELGAETWAWCLDTGDRPSDLAVKR